MAGLFIARTVAGKSSASGSGARVPPMSPIIAHRLRGFASLQILDWIKKDQGQPDHPMRNPAAAAKLLAELRKADPLAALKDLTAWLDAVKAIPDSDETIRSEILSHIEEASYPHLSVLLAQYFAKQADKQAEREATWHPLSNFLAALTGALCKSAVHLLRESATNPSLKLAGAADAARALRACRVLLKFHLARYLSVPPIVWRMAYSVHRNAETADCAGMPVRMHTAQKTATTVTQELLRLLMLQTCSPEMMTPEQIEVADWAIEQLGDDFTLRPPGVADNPFCFESAGEGPPRRAAGLPSYSDTGRRYFGTGTAHDALGRIYKQLATTGTAEIGTFGKALAPHVQLSAVQHLVAFLGATPPYTPPERSPATGALQVTPGYARTWQHLSTVGSAKMELTLAQDGDVPAQAPETWALKDTGGHELGAEIPQRSGEEVRCGDVVGVSPDVKDGFWVGLVISMHAESAHGLHASIFVICRNPQALSLRPVITKDEENAFSENSARQFAFNSVRAIILSDGSAAPHPANMLLPPDSWKEGRIFEATVEEAVRYLRCGRILRRGNDYVRATFEWVAQP